LAEDANNDVILSLENVSFSYNSAIIIDNVSLTVNARELSAIVGPNGGGKTTLLKLILGILRPKSGVIKLFGASPEVNRRLVGYVPQHIQFDPQFPITVSEVVSMGRLGFGRFFRFSKSDYHKVDRALERMGIENLKNSLFSEISGGQRQRVLIARALVSDPKLLLLDEPTANIDAVAENQLFETLVELNKEMAMLMVSHDVSFVSAQVGKVICVNKKVIVHPTSDIQNDTISNMYGESVKLIRHDLHLNNATHDHD